MRYNPHLFADISSNNGGFSARAYKRAGLIMIAVKATQGTHYENPRWAGWVNAAHRAGLCVTHYHYAELDRAISGIQEAEYFARTIAPHFHHGDRICIDTEHTTLMTSEELAAWVDAFADVMYWHTGHGLVCYASAAWFREVGALLPATTREVWLADWSSASEWPEGTYTRWARQFTDGRIGPLPHVLPGIGNCDVSIMSHETYARLIGR